MPDQPVPTRAGHVHPDGYDIWYEYFGDGKREAIVLLNGLAMSTRAWYGFLPLLLDEYDVLLYDYLGQGESSKPDEPYSITKIASYLTTIMDELSKRPDIFFPVLKAFMRAKSTKFEASI